MKISLFANYLKINYSGKNKTPVYAIDSSLNCQKFKSQAEAADKLNMTQGYIWRCLQDKNLHTKGYLFRYANEIENGDGTLNIDRKQMSEIFNTLPVNTHKKKIYAVFEDGSYLKFDSFLEAAKHFNLSQVAISKYVHGEMYCGLNVIFKLANEIEKFNKDGSLDIQKTNLAIQKASKEVRKEIAQITTK